MRPSKYPLSKNDFESGRFSALADFVRSNWPFNGSLTEDESKEAVAKTLGYDGYSDAFMSATAKAHSPSIGDFDLKRNFDKLDIVQSALQGTSNAEDQDEKKSSEDVLEYLIAQFNGPTGDFLDSWPMDLVGRWNYEQNGCAFSIEFMKNLEGEFEKIWSSSNFNSDGFVSALENTNSAGSFIIQETLNHDIDSLESLAIKDILDSELCEALLQDSLPNLINEVLTVSSHDAEVLVYETGMSLADLWALPRNEDGYPSLYEHMRKYLFDVVLEKKVITLFIKDRDKSGFYTPHHDYDANLEDKPVYPEEVNFVFHHDRDEMDCENFRSYTWVTEARSKDGILLAKAVGSYIHGPASRPTSGANLIFSLDQVGDYDVEIVDMVQTVLQNKIYEDDDQVVDKSELNMQLIFGYGNLMTLTHWERSCESKPGLGLDLLGYTIDMLKKRFKRNIYVAAILDAYQYTNDGQLHPVVRKKRFHDIGKIANNLGQLHSSSYVLGVFSSMRHIAEGPGAFVRHCGEAYGRHYDGGNDE